MKNLLLMIAIFGIQLLAFSQNPTPLQDAIDYQKAVDSKDTRTMKAIILKYTDSTQNWTNKLVDISEIPDTTRGEFQGEASANEFRSATSNLQGMMIDALATVIADRFREELTQAFLLDFRKKLETQAWLGGVFPNTERVLVYSDPFNFKSWMSTFRAAMEADLKEIPANIPVLIEEVGKASGLDSQKLQLIQDAAEIYPMLSELWENPGNSFGTLQNVVEKIKTLVKNEKAKNSLEIANMLLDGLSHNGEDWAPKADLDKLSKNPKVLKCFLAFVMEKNKAALKNIKINVNGSEKDIYSLFQKTTTTAGNAPNKAQTEADSIARTKVISVLSNLVNGICVDVKSIEASLTTLLNIRGEGKTPNFEDYGGLINSSLNMLNQLASDDFVFLLGKIAPSDTNKLALILKDVRKGVSFALSVNELAQKRDYSSIILETLQLVETYAQNKEKLENNPSMLTFMKYATLASNLASAESAEAMGDAIDASILPVGSFRVKRNTHFSVSVNAYAGLYGGMEVLNNSDAKYKNSFLAAFTAPVGIGFNWGLKACKPKKNTSLLPAKSIIELDSTFTTKNKFFSGSSFSLYVTIIDVGAIAAFRLQDDETPVSTVQWSNIIAPGLYCSFGLGNSPLALNIGAQYGPGLRRVEAKETAVDLTIDSRAFRYGLGLVVDIPLYTIYSREEKIKDKRK